LLDFDQLEAVVASIDRVDNFNRSTRVVDTFTASQTDSKGIKDHLDSLSDPDAPKAKPKAMSFGALQSRIASMGN